MTAPLETYELSRFDDEDLRELALTKAGDLCRDGEDPQPLAEALLEVLSLMRSMHRARA